jgi:hypothetical protein
MSGFKLVGGEDRQIRPLIQHREVMRRDLVSQTG